MIGTVTHCVVYSAIHIGILDFSLFRETPEFYAGYKLMNEKNHHIYSDKFQLRVLELNQVELATEEDQKYQIDRWAKLFKATTWEDLRMIAEKDHALAEQKDQLDAYRKRMEDLEAQLSKKV